tara:strand:+ start:347 stop:760 length:414 start_codon:yes stop_codon:yes gene_type:complete
MNNSNLFIWKGFRRRRNEESPVSYCNNVARVGGKLIVNRGSSQIKSRNIGGELKFSSKSSSHFWDRRIERGITCLDVINTVNHGIRFRSDVKSGRRWLKRELYLWHNFVVVLNAFPRFLITTYKIDPTNCTFDKGAL